MGKEVSFMEVKYLKHKDGRVIFSKGWGEFVENKGLKTEKAVLFRILTTTSDDYALMMVMDILTDDPRVE